MIRTTVKAHSKEESEQRAREIGANWFGCRPEEVDIIADRTEAETECVEHSDMLRTVAVPTETVYYTNYRIYAASATEERNR